MSKLYSLIILMLLNSLSFDYVTNKLFEDVSFGVFSWYEEDMSKEWTTSVMKDYKVKTVYQCFTHKINVNQVQKYVETMNDEGVDVFYLCGEPEWALKKHSDEMIKEIEFINEINNKLSPENKIKGIVFDVEPHSLKGFKDNSDDYMNMYRDAVLNAYAKKGDLEVKICVPYYYDDLGYEDILRDLIANGCDELLVMNYHRGNEINGIENEYKMCNELNKGISSIYELEQPLEGVITEKNTYFGQSVYEVFKNMFELKVIHGYDNLDFSYHELRSLNEMNRQPGN